MGVRKIPFFNLKGLDLRSNDLNRPIENASAALNMQHRLSGDLEKRKGHKAVAEDIGGGALFTHILFDTETLAETEELLTIGDGRLWRSTVVSFTITYAGSGDVLCSWFYNPDDDDWNLLITEDGATVLDATVGIGVDEASPVDLSDLKTLVDAISGGDFSATIVGDDTIPAAFLFPVQDQTIIEDTGGTLVLYTKDWEEVNSPSELPFSGGFTNRNEAEWETATTTTLNNSTYIATGYDELHKYDGQTVYRAGVPQLEAPSALEVSATGVAEITSITCATGSAVAEITQITLNASTPTDLNQAGFFIYDSAGSVGVYFRRSGTHTPPSGLSGAARYIEIDIAGATTIANCATTLQTTIHADSAFNATVSGVVVTITDAATGLRTDASVPAIDDWQADIEIDILQQGTAGLDGSYFVIYGASGSNKFWIDVDNNGTPEPGPSFDTSTEITTVTTGMTAAQIATAIEAVIEAHVDYTSTVSGAVITVTDAATGSRPDPSAGTTPFSISVTTQGVNGGLGAGDYIYHLTAEHEDHNGLITEGHFSEDDSVTLASGKDAQLTIATIQPDSGFNTGCAIVNGNQTNVNTINVDTGHTLYEGDKVFFKGQAQAAVSEVTKITTVADVAGSLDGKYFLLYGVDGTEEAWAIWFDIDNNGTAEPSHGAPNSIEITTLSTGATADQVATAVQGVIDAAAQWSATVSTNEVTVTDSFAGLRTNAADGELAPTTFSFTVMTAGQEARAGENLTRELTATTSSSITVDGDVVTVTDNQVISAGLKINIWRTKEGEAADIKYLVDTIPNNSLATSLLYTDSTLDAALGAPWVEPEDDHDLPPMAKYVAAWNNVLVLGGIPGDESSVAYSIPYETSPEYFPDESNKQLMNSAAGDRVRGLFFSNGVFAVLKDRSHIVLSGDIFSGAIRVDQTVKRDMAFAAHAGLVDVGPNILFVDKTGIFRVLGGQPPEPVSLIIKPLFVGNQEFEDNATYTWNRARAIHDRENERTWFFVPVGGTSSVTGGWVATSESRVFVYEWYHDSWFYWTGINAAMGAVYFDGDLYFKEARETSDGAVAYYLYRVNDENVDYDYIDHNTAISGQWSSAWLDGGSASDKKKFVDLKLYAETTPESSGNSITVTTNRDYDQATTHSSFTLTPHGSTRVRQRLRPGLSRSLRFNFTNAVENNNMLISGFEITVKPPSDGDSIGE